MSFLFSLFNPRSQSAIPIEACLSTYLCAVSQMAISSKRFIKRQFSVHACGPFCTYVVSTGIIFDHGFGSSTWPTAYDLIQGHTSSEKGTRKKQREREVTRGWLHEQRYAALLRTVGFQELVLSHVRWTTLSCFHRLRPTATAQGRTTTSVQIQPGS